MNEMCINACITTKLDNSGPSISDNHQLTLCSPTYFRSSSFALHVTIKRVPKFFDKFDVTMSTAVNRDNCCDKGRFREPNRIRFVVRTWLVILSDQYRIHFIMNKINYNYYCI